MECPGCHLENPELNRFCGGCGSVLAQVCRDCGNENSSDQGFCGGCGVALEAETRTPADYTPRHLAQKILSSKAAIEGERKRVTVLFADIRCSTELASAVDIEDWHAILDRFFTLTQQMQADTHAQTGTVYGCAFGNLSGELLALDDAIRKKLREIFTRYYAYFEAILHEANAQGLVAIDDVPRKAKSLFAFFEGMQMLAHTHNDPTLITEMTRDMRALITA